MKLISLLFIALSFSTITLGQIVIDATPTAADLVTNTLIGQGLVTSNITFSGDPAQIGFFNGIASNIGLDSGVVMSSGNVVDIAVPGGNPSTTIGGPGDADVCMAINISRWLWIHGNSSLSAVMIASEPPN